MHLNRFADVVKFHVNQLGLVGLNFYTIGVSDGISMGTDGMRYSLVSRDIIADSIETNAGAEWYDGIVALVGCDKNMPGAAMGIGRLNRPSLIIYGGTIAAGYYEGQKLDIVSAFEALGQKIAGTITEEEYKQIIENACPGAGACGGMYTANTMASALEAMGLSLPYSSSNPANSKEKKAEMAQAAAAIKVLLEKDIKPKDIMTKKAFENAIRLIIILGGSTNAVMHLIAMAKAVDIEITLNDFIRLGEITPMLADFRPSGKYVMEDLQEQGGTPAVLKFMLENGLLHGDCMTVTGKTLAENLSELPGLKEGQQIVHSLDNPIKKTSHIRILHGNMAAEGAVAKITGMEGEYFEGPARVFNSEQESIDAMMNRQINKGDVVIIRYVDPRGGPACPKC